MAPLSPLFGVSICARIHAAQGIDWSSQVLLTLQNSLDTLCNQYDAIPPAQNLLDAETYFLVEWHCNRYDVGKCDRYSLLHAMLR